MKNPIYSKFNKYILCYNIFSQNGMFMDKVIGTIMK